MNEVTKLKVSACLGKKREKEMSRRKKKERKKEREREGKKKCEKERKKKGKRETERRRERERESFLKRCYLRTYEHPFATTSTRGKIQKFSCLAFHV